MRTFAWQGWQIELPDEWNPVKLEGDSARGHVLITDMSRPRLGIRWATPGEPRINVDAWVTRTLREEIGERAAEAASSFQMPNAAWTGSRLAVDDDRCAWVACSGASQRLIEIVNHGGTLNELLPSLRDTEADADRLWSVFDLRCTVPAKYALESKRLNAGDLSLSFEHDRLMLTVRQVALARIALAQMPLERWLSQWLSSQNYYEARAPAEVDSGLMQYATLRRRFAWMWWRPPQLVTMARHDQARDRLVFVQANDAALVRQVAETVGR